MSNEVSIPDRLKWIRDQMQRLLDNGRIRAEGETDFIMAKNELDDVIATYTAPVAKAPDIINKVFQPGELEALAASITDRLLAETEKMLDELEKSDVAVMAALAETRTELLAAVAPAA